MIRKAFAPVMLAVVLVLGGSSCGGLGPESRSATTVDARDEAATLATNDFIPQDVNLGDCVSSMPRPDCGSKAHGGGHQLATFAVLMLGMAFIGWRIFRSVRRAERERDGSAQPS